MGIQTFGQIITVPVSADFATITAITETVLIPTALTPIAALPYATKVYELTVGGTCTTGAAGTLIINPRFGTTIAGTSLGVSFTQNYVPSITTGAFLLRCFVAVRSNGLPGANSTMVCSGTFSLAGAAATAASSTELIFGGASVGALDTSVASALWIGITFSVAPSLIPRWHMWRDLS